MRLDKFLKNARIIKRRTVANEACDAGRIVINGKPAKASYEVKVGDILETTLGGKPIKVKITSLQDNPRKENASLLFEPVD